MDCGHFEETRLNRPLITHLIIWVSLLSTAFIVSPSLWNQTVTGKYFYFAAVVAATTLVTAYRLFRRRAAFRICLTDALFSFSIVYSNNFLSLRESKIKNK